MPKGAAAKLIARDQRKHKEERKVKVKNKRVTKKNQHEYLKRKKQRGKKGKGVDINDIFKSGGIGDDFDVAHTYTDDIYQNFLESKDFMLTFQPQLIEELSSESEEEEDDDDKKSLT